MADPTLIAVAKDAVDRARLGDQNAMGLIVACRDAAMAGGAKAKEALRVLANVAGVPATELSPVVSGEDGSAETLPPHVTYDTIRTFVGAGAVLFTPAHLSRIVLALPEGVARDTFLSCVNDPRRDCRDRPLHYLPPPLRTVAVAAHCYGMAARFQRFLNGEPMSVYCPDMAWELGE